MFFCFCFLICLSSYYHFSYNSSSLSSCYTAGPVIIDAPANQQVLIGTDVVLNCTSTSEPLHSVVWLYNSTIEIATYNATTRYL